jgi:hypothetical protein
MLVPEEAIGSPFQRGRNGARDACASLGSLTNINSHPRGMAQSLKGRYSRSIRLVMILRGLQACG